MKMCPHCGESHPDDMRLCPATGKAVDNPPTIYPLDTLDRPKTAAAGDTAPPPRPKADTLDGATISAAELGPGVVLGGRYRIVEQLGAGGMGQVFKALDAEMNDMPVAIKVLPPTLAGNRRSIENLRREAAIALKLSHPNICRLHTFNSDGAIKYLVMEYIAGNTLDELLDAHPDRRMTPAEVLPIALQVAAALDFAHAQRPPILHRDIKPSNIMLTPYGTAKVLDFGIAREMKESMTRVTGKETSGTLLYMSPEQFNGERVGPASDVYSFAATMYECLGGHPPFWQGAIGHQLLHMEPKEIAGLPPHVNAALMAALAKRPEERPRSAGMLAGMLHRPPAGWPVPAQVHPMPAEIDAAIERLHAPQPRSRAGARTAPKRGLQAWHIVLAVSGVFVLAAIAWLTASSVERFHEQAPARWVEPPPEKEPEKPVQQPVQWAEPARPALAPLVPPKPWRNSLDMEFVFIPPGEFMMGSPEDEGPQHRVRITKGFYMGVTEVTQAQWQAVMGNNPSNFKGESLPVERVSWNDATEFCRKLSAMEGKTYRLPTEAEWEYACRAGSTGPYAGNGRLDDMGWYGDNSGGKTHAVGTKQANAWGLYDMHGNVWEWCQSEYKAYPYREDDGRESLVDKNSRVLRGGSWSGSASNVKTGYRYYGHAPARVHASYGFRCARTLD